jgi:hypothetical protein
MFCLARNMVRCTRDPFSDSFISYDMQKRVASWSNIRLSLKSVRHTKQQDWCTWWVPFGVFTHDMRRQDWVRGLITHALNRRTHLDDPVQAYILVTYSIYSWRDSVLIYECYSERMDMEWTSVGVPHSNVRATTLPLSLIWDLGKWYHHMHFFY